MLAEFINFRFLLLIWISMTTLFVAADLNALSQDNVPSAPLPSNGAAVDEVVVESSLYIKPKVKPMLRRTKRSLVVSFLGGNALPSSFIEHKRVKRVPEPQPRRRNHPQQQQDYGQSQAAANAAADSQYNDQHGFGSSAGNALSQAFNARGPAGGFGASSAGSLSQALNADRYGGVENSAGASMSQVYHLPNGQTINFALTNSFANAPGNRANSRGGAVSVSQP